MGTKSAELDRQLKEILNPHGFVKIPHRRQFVRLYADGIIQTFDWTWDPHDKENQSLVFSTDSVWQYISEHDESLVLYHKLPVANPGFSLSEYYCLYNGISNYNTYYMSEEQQLDYLSESFLPIINECDSQEKLYKFRFMVNRHFQKEMVYKLASDLNLSLLLGDYDHAKKCIENGIEYENWIIQQSKEICLHTESSNIPQSKKEELNVRFNERLERCTYTINHYLRIKKMLDSTDSIAEYLNECKRKYINMLVKVLGKRARGIIDY